jgi:hypothetical protein
MEILTAAALAQTSDNNRYVGRSDDAQHTINTPINCYTIAGESSRWPSSTTRQSRRAFETSTAARIRVQ